MKAVVMLSGGVDSTVALAVTLDAGHQCEAVSFDYGQIHRRELIAAEVVADHYKVHHTIIALPCGVLTAPSALTGDLTIPDGHAEKLDSTYVPARNLLMLSVAAAVAENHGARSVVFGANADDAAGYQDCRPRFIDAMNTAVRLGTITEVSVWAPLVRMTKREIIIYGKQLGAPLGSTWSCYRGGEVQCGRCGACEANGVTA